MSTNRQLEPSDAKIGELPPQQVQAHRNFYLIFAIALLLVYIAPMVLGIYAGIASGGFNRDDASVSYFATFLGQPDATLNLFHKILFPIILGISAFAFKDKTVGIGVILLVIVLMISLMVSVSAGIYFDVPKVRKAIEGLDDAPSPELVKSYFSRTQEVLLMYLTSILGLHMANRK
jgi:hypothetical protein